MRREMTRTTAISTRVKKATKPESRDGVIILKDQAPRAVDEADASCGL